MADLARDQTTRFRLASGRSVRGALHAPLAGGAYGVVRQFFQKRPQTLRADQFREDIKRACERCHPAGGSVCGLAQVHGGATRQSLRPGVWRRRDHGPRRILERVLTTEPAACTEFRNAKGTVYPIAASVHCDDAWITAEAAWMPTDGERTADIRALAQTEKDVPSFRSIPPQIGLHSVPDVFES